MPFDLLTAMPKVAQQPPMKQIARFTTVPALALCSLPSGCAGGSRFAQDAQVPQDKAVVYIYKKGGFAGSANSFKI